MNARITYVKGLQFVGEADSGHAVVMDGTPSSGGHNTGASPMELLLLGIGGCSGMDVISVLKKKKQRVTGFGIRVKAERAEGFPKRFTHMHLTFEIKGTHISEDAVRKAIDLSMNKYCSVKASLEGSANITFSHKITEE